MDPTDPTHLFVGVNTGPFFDPPLTEQGYYYSTNGGRNWNGSSILPGITGDYASDPAVAFNADGIAFFNYIETTPVFKAKVQKSIDGGFTWGSQIVTIPTAYSDKNHMAVDITNSNFKDNIYVAFSDQINKIRFSRSTDGGSIFSTAENIDGSFPGTSRGVNLVVGTNGEVYAVWALGPGVDEGDSGQSSIINDWAEEGAETNLIFNMSANGGSNWSGAADIFNIQGIKGFWYHKNNDLVAIRVNSFPSVAVDHSGGIWDGTIYLVWTDESLYGDPDIVLSKSADGGTTWSNPVRVNDDPSGNGLDQWFPWVSVNPYGLINIVFMTAEMTPITALRKYGSPNQQMAGKASQISVLAIGLLCPVQYKIWRPGIWAITLVLSQPLGRPMHVGWIPGFNLHSQSQNLLIRFLLIVLTLINPIC